MSPIEQLMGCHEFLYSTTSTSSSQPTRTDSSPPKRMATCPIWATQMTDIFYALERFCMYWVKGWSHTLLIWFITELECSTCCPCSWMFDFWTPHHFDQLWCYYRMLYAFRFECSLCWYIDLFSTFYFMHRSFVALCCDSCMSLLFYVLTELVFQISDAKSIVEH